MAEPLFVEQLNINCPPGFNDAVRVAARQEGQTASEFIRSAVRDKLKAVQAPTEQAAGAGD